MAEGRPFLPVRKLVLFIPSDFKGWRQRSLLFSSRQEINMGIRTFDAICNKYFAGGTPDVIKSAALDSTKDQLVVATNAAFEPFEDVYKRQT